MREPFYVLQNWPSPYHIWTSGVLNGVALLRSIQGIENRDYAPANTSQGQHHSLVIKNSYRKN